MDLLRRMFLLTMILFVALSCNDDNGDNLNPEPEVKYYTNPLFLPGQSRTIGVGDPSSIRWMGKYYMTVSRNPNDLGIMMWESENLVEWTYLGTVSNASAVRDAWAPEIIYYEGDFYMYTSGPDQNHRVLKLEASTQGKPTPYGGYTVVNTNMFPQANHDGVGGIQYVKTDSPVDGDKPVSQLTKCFVKVPEDDRGSTWTEGPTIIKQNDIYYMTYCGNDVIRVDYQVHAASGSSIEALTPISHNPILKHTEGFYNGTGHSHDVLGPDLKTYYTTYHVKHYEGNLADNGKPLMRSLMLDKIEFHPDGDVTSGVTFDEQLVPQMADWSDNFERDDIGDNWTVTGAWSMHDSYAISGNGDGVMLLSKEKTSGAEYVVEGYVKVQAGAVGGIVVDNGNLKVLLDYGNKQLIVKSSQGVTNVDLPDSNFDVWRQIKISLKGGMVIVWFDNMKKYQDSYSGSGESSIGYFVETGEADFAWIAFTAL